MSLTETLPPALETAIRSKSDGSPIQVAVATDLTLQGIFGEEWLIITDDMLRVYAADSMTPRLELSLATMKAPVTGILIGGGALMARDQDRRPAFARSAGSTVHPPAIPLPALFRQTLRRLHAAPAAQPISLYGCGRQPLYCGKHRSSGLAEQGLAASTFINGARRAIYFMRNRICSRAR
jgi:hypothetical protein